MQGQVMAFQKPFTQYETVDQFWTKYPNGWMTGMKDVKNDLVNKLLTMLTYEAVAHRLNSLRDNLGLFSDCLVFWHKKITAFSLVFCSQQLSYSFKSFTFPSSLGNIKQLSVKGSTVENNTDPKPTWQKQ